MKSPNITLTNLSEIRQSGFCLALRKLKNELLNRKKGDVKAEKHYGGRKYNAFLSVVICTANRPEMAANAVKSILTQEFDKALYEVILVNNGKTPLPEIQGVKIVDEPCMGLSKARNTGAGCAKGEYLLYMDDDAEACRGMLENMYNAFKAHKECGIIGGQIFLELPSPVPKVFLEGREALWSAYTVPYKGFRRVKEQYEFPYGACFGVRHSLLDKAGGFPEGFGRRGQDYGGGEEIALCFMAQNMGSKIGIQPKSAVIHKVARERFTEEHVRNTIYQGIVTTQRLYKEGYAPKGWTDAYIKERIEIIKQEIAKLTDNPLAKFYKQCELNAFMDLE